jgi:hypothetical protein
MPKSKKNKNIKVRDLKPSKDAKGGGHTLASAKTLQSAKTAQSRPVSLA